MNQLKHTCFEFTTTICSALIGCDKDSVGTLKLLLQCAVQTILKQKQCDSNTFSKTLPPTVLQTSQSIIAATSSAPFPAAAKHIFYSHHQFPQLADVLLTFIAPNYLDTFFSQSEKDDLFYVWFQQAPPLSLLLTLSDQLTMEIGYINTSRSSTRITTAAGEFTSQLLESYFSPSSFSSSSSFIQDIITQLSQSNTSTNVDEDVEKLSIALSSLLDKAAPYYDTCPSLRPATFIPTIITSLLHIDNINNNNDTSSSLKVLADLMTRLSRRGHVAFVATTLITAVQQQQEGKEENIVNVQQCIKMAEDSHGLGTLLLSMITQSSSSLPILPLVLPRSTWIERTDVQQLTTNTWLGHYTLHPTAINQLLDYLHHTIDTDQVLLLLPGIVARLAAVWGDVSGTIQVMSLRQQACITYIIVQCLKRMNKHQVEQYPRLLMSVLSGVSARLESPLIVVKKQGMRVGDALSLVLEPGKKPLFYDTDDSNGDNCSNNSSGDDVFVLIGCAEEQWWSEATGTGEADNGKTTIKKKEKETIKEKMPPRKDRIVPRKNSKIEEEEQGSGGVLTETDSDDDGIISITSSDSEFEQYDVSDSDSDDDGNDDGGKHSHIQLRDLPKMLTKGVNGKDTQGWKDQILALRLTESLVRASPDELPMHAESLAKALLYAQLPKWLDEEMKPGSGSSTVEGQRYKNMVTLLLEVPEQAGLTIASHVYSPSLDMHQRVLALNALSTAAEELAHPGKHLAITTRKQQCEGDEERRRRVSSGMTVDGQQRIGRVTWMAQQTLANLQQQQEMMRIGSNSNSNSSSQYVPTSINRFPSVALKWAAALLKECDVQKHGVDLFGRDAYLLGKLLTTLGTFIECCSGTTSAQPLALATMELLHIPRIHDHPEPFVRRAALLLAGHVVSQGVPPSLLASAALLLSSSSSSSSSSKDTINISSTIIAYSTTTDLTITTGIDTTTEETAVRLLHWLMQWVDSVADKDSDETCIKMGVSVKNLSSQIAAQVLIGDKEGYIKNHEVRITGLGDKGVLSMKGPTVSKIPR
jgi:telomere length regulation protein